MALGDSEANVVELEAKGSPDLKETLGSQDHLDQLE